MKVLKQNWYGFNHDLVAKKFGGDLTFVNYFCVKREYHPVAVYRAANPDTSKGHKRYMLLQSTDSGGLVRGMTEEEMEKERFQGAAHCLNCDLLVYSVNRHNYISCECKEDDKKIFVDGGKDYFKMGFGKKSLFETGQLDLLTDEFTKKGESFC